MAGDEPPRGAPSALFAAGVVGLILQSPGGADALQGVWSMSSKQRAGAAPAAGLLLTPCPCLGGSPAPR